MINAFEMFINIYRVLDTLHAAFSTWCSPSRVEATLIRRKLVAYSVYFYLVRRKFTGFHGLRGRYQIIKYSSPALPGVGHWWVWHLFLLTEAQIYRHSRGRCLYVNFFKKESKGKSSTFSLTPHLALCWAQHLYRVYYPNVCYSISI